MRRNKLMPYIYPMHILIIIAVGLRSGHLYFDFFNVELLRNLQNPLKRAGLIAGTAKKRKVTCPV
jgi:hypothetical protein